MVIFSFILTINQFWVHIINSIFYELFEPGINNLLKIQDKNIFLFFIIKTLGKNKKIWELYILYFLITIR